MKNILPSGDNEKIMELSRAVRRASEHARDIKKPVFFFIDMDNHSFWMQEDPSEQANSVDAEATETTLRFARAKNSRMETDGGMISFIMRPDGSREFGLISVQDMETEENYTVFINPCLSSPEILKGEAEFYDAP